jgi:EAL domain-containing protein (putative c-di-GMP-specific phosphodiesterase class I)
VLKQIEAGRVPGEVISFEIMCADALRFTDRVAALSAQLKDSGCTFTLASCDGEAVSMDVLKRLMPGFVKIRSGLIGRMDRDPMAAARVGVLNRKCHEMGIRTIAEHVEREETMEILRVTGIDFAQGFLVGCPHALD